MIKKPVSTAIDIIFYMAVALGIISILNLIFMSNSNVPTILIVTGLILGLITWWRKAKIVEGMRRFIDIKFLKFYVYLYQFLLYIIASFGFLELFCLYFGQSSIEVYESFTLSYTFSWKSLFTTLIILLGWQASAENLYAQIIDNMQKA